MNMDKYLMITDVNGKQYPMLITDKGIHIEDFVVTVDNYNLSDIQACLETAQTFRVENRVFRTEHVIEVSINEIPRGAH
jgi:hypothetical protein